MFGCCTRLSIDASGIHGWGMHSSGSTYYKLSRLSSISHPCNADSDYKRSLRATLGRRQSDLTSLLSTYYSTSHCQRCIAVPCQPHAVRTPRCEIILPTPTASIPPIFVDMKNPISSHFKASGGYGMLPSPWWTERGDKTQKKEKAALDLAGAD